MDEEQKGLWYHVNKRTTPGKRPKRPGEKGYPSAKAWKKLTSESIDLIRQLVRESVRELDPMSSGGWTSPEHEAWLKSLEDEQAEYLPDDDKQSAAVGETSGGMDRPLGVVK
jgi:hypothetical protein